MSSPSFIDQDPGESDLGQLRTEIFPLIGLIALFGGLALLAFLCTLLVA